MTKLHPITAEIDGDTMTIVERLAKKRGLTGQQFAAEAIRRITESEEDFDAFLQVGIDAIERGDVVPHEQVMAELDRMIEKHRARCA